MSRRLYIDGIWDLFHMGHVKQLMELKQLDGLDNHLIVGIISDKVATGYKRTPIYTENHRQILVESCKYVDEIILNTPLAVDEEFIYMHRIDMVCHGFSDTADADKQDEYFKIPKQLNKFRIVEYHKGISTTEIINKILKLEKPIHNQIIEGRRVNENIILDISDK